MLWDSRSHLERASVDPNDDNMLQYKMWNEKGSVMLLVDKRIGFATKAISEDGNVVAIWSNFHPGAQERSQFEVPSDYSRR